MNIEVTPEGREGVYTVEKKALTEWLAEYEHNEIHNYMPSGIMMGADWSKDSVIDHIGNCDRCAILTGRAKSGNLGHSLAVITGNELNLFDVLGLEEENLTVVNPQA